MGTIYAWYSNSYFKCLWDSKDLKNREFFYEIYRWLKIWSGAFASGIFPYCTSLWSKYVCK